MLHDKRLQGTCMQNNLTKPKKYKKNNAFNNNNIGTQVLIFWKMLYSPQSIEFFIIFLKPKYP